MTRLYGGIEAGGTKFVCAVGSGPDHLCAEESFKTTTPAETLPKVIGFFEKAQAEFGAISAVGVASFGPIDLHPASATYGYITSTPKLEWANTDLLGAVKRGLGVPVAFDTDVNGAALGEGRWGAGQGLDTFLYLTVGTGIGGGALIGGEPLHGLLHPEMGHVPISRDRGADPFAGVCPYHGDCFEGLASGPAMEARWGQRAETLPPDHPAWEIEANVIAQALTTFIYTLSPQRIILGGGVMQQGQLFPLIRSEVDRLINGYVRSAALVDEGYIVPPMLGTRAGVLGAIAMAERVG